MTSPRIIFNGAHYHIDYLLGFINDLNKATKGAYIEEHNQLINLARKLRQEQIDNPNLTNKPSERK
jgi:hypothetical protein